jgi:hypothetical protein
MLSIHFIYSRWAIDYVGVSKSIFDVLGESSGGVLVARRGSRYQSIVLTLPYVALDNVKYKS